MTSKDYRDALVGAVFDDPLRKLEGDKLVITSPNMVALPYWQVHLDRCAVSVYDDERCGHWDYLLQPQVFHRELGHLPVILCPDLTAPNSPRAIMHQPLNAQNDWRPVSWSNTEYGTIDKELADTLYKVTQDVIQKYNALVQEKVEATGSSVAAKDYSTRKSEVKSLAFFANRLQDTASFSTCTHVWAQCQRLTLEVRAFMDFMAKYQPLFRDLPSTPLPVDLDRLGAITRDPRVAHDLFMVGLPTYFVRPKGAVDLVKVQRLLTQDEVFKALQERGIVRSGHQPGAPNTKVLFVPRHVKPNPSPLIFVGSVDSVNRPRAIMAWSRKAHPLQTAPLDRSTAQHEDMIKFGLADAAQPGAVPKPPVATVADNLPSTSSLAPGAPSANSVSQNRRRQGGRPKGQQTSVRTVTAPSTSTARATVSQKPAEPSTVRNKWVTTSTWMPEALAIWEEESRELGNGHSESILPTWPGATPLWRGYIVPEAALIAALSDDQRSWTIFIVVRLMTELEYLVEHGSEPWKNADWRRLVTIGQAEYAKSLTSSASTGYKEKTKTSVQREQSLHHFNQCMQRLRSSHVSLSLEDILKPVSWRGVMFKHGSAVTRRDTQMVLAHLNEIEFRWELTNLDGVLFDWDRYRLEFASKTARLLSENENLPAPMPMTPSTRRKDVIRSVSHFENQIVPGNEFYQRHRGFDSDYSEFKVHALRDLSRLMDQWKAPFRLSPDVFGEIERLGALHIHRLSQSGKEIAAVERSIAKHYIRMYKDVYSRAPVLPRSTYWPM